MGPPVVVVLGIRPERPIEMPSTQDDGPVGALAAVGRVTGEDVGRHPARAVDEDIRAATALGHQSGRGAGYGADGLAGWDLGRGRTADAAIRSTTAIDAAASRALDTSARTGPTGGARLKAQLKSDQHNLTHAWCWVFGHRSATPRSRDQGWEPTRVMAPGVHPGAICAHCAGGATCSSYPSCPSSCRPIWSPKGGSKPSQCRPVGFGVLPPEPAPTIGWPPHAMC